MSKLVTKEHKHFDEIKVLTTINNFTFALWITVISNWGGIE